MDLNNLKLVEHECIMTVDFFPLYTCSLFTSLLVVSHFTKPGIHYAMVCLLLHVGQCYIVIQTL
jgi:hypothetical protein